MKETNSLLTIADVQRILFDMLEYIDDICKQHNIKYFLSGGTALGTVREKGFIPWDDDIDLMLPRDEYEKLIIVFKTISNTKYKFYSLSDKQWDRPYACLIDNSTTGTHEYMNYKNVGVTIDILPIDGLADSAEESANYYRYLRKIYTFYYASIKKKYMEHEKHIIIKKILEIISKAIGANRICKFINYTARKKDYNHCKYVGCSILCLHMEKERFLKSWFSNQVYMTFEGKLFPVMNGFDEYLSQLYGDYMKPPTNKINPDHRTIFKKIIHN